MFNNSQGKFSVHVDCDNSWISESELGVTHNFLDKNYMYEVSLKNLLNLFHLHSIKATFFIVGKDLNELKSCQEFCKIAIINGHKIGNHSYSHPMNFGELGVIDREKEILDAHNVIYEKLKYQCRAFRAPGYGVNNHDLTVLAEKDYIYDSSILPGFATLIMKLYVLKIKSYRTKSFRVWSNFFASTKLKKYYLTNNLSIWRIPVTVFPFLRLPVHTSFLFSLTILYTYISMNALNLIKSPKIILFHGLDLSNQTPGTYQSIIPAFNIPFEKRFKICDLLLSSIKNKSVHLDDILQ